MLDEHPNVMVEFGAREAELGRQPRQTREFFLKYQDRIMFGTDNGMDEEMYRNHFRWLETADESFDSVGISRAGTLGDLRPGIARSGAGKDLSPECRDNVQPVQGLVQGRKLMSAEAYGKSFAVAGRFSGCASGALRSCFSLARAAAVPQRKQKLAAPEPSQIKVEAKPGGPIVLTTSSAEFQILPSGYIQASSAQGRPAAHAGRTGRRRQ